MKIERTKTGLPVLWESGGGYTSTGNATIIAGRDGKPKNPVYIRRRGHLANGDHALFVVAVGDLVCRADHHRGDFNIEVHEIAKIEDESCELVRKHEYSRGEWDIIPPDALHGMIDAAVGKATCYHCREPHFIEEEEKKCLT